MAPAEAVVPCPQCGRNCCRTQFHCVRVALNRAFHDAGYTRLQIRLLSRSLTERGVPWYYGITVDRTPCLYVPEWAERALWVNEGDRDPYVRLAQALAAMPEILPPEVALEERLASLYTLLALAGWFFHRGQWRHGSV